jgi:hypothetical protein
MGGDDSQKLRPWRGAYSSPGAQQPPAHCEINTLAQSAIYSRRGVPDMLTTWTVLCTERLRGQPCRSASYSRCLWCRCAAAQSLDRSERVRNLLKTPLSKDLQAVRAEVVGYGNDSVGPLVEFVADHQASPIRIAFLLDALAGVNTLSSRAALIGCLHDSRPFVRAYAALALGRARVYCAIPAIIPLIGDASVYAQEVSTDPYTEAPMTVKTAALTSLEQLTGLKVRRLSIAKQRQALERYWLSHSSHFRCEEK